MFLENQAFPVNKIVDERISRAINNDHTAAMKAPSEGKKHKKKGGIPYGSDMITVCMLCQKAFKNPIFYRKHMRLHSDKVHCQVCGKSVRKHQLQQHVQTVHQRPFKVTNQKTPPTIKFSNQKTQPTIKFKKVFKCEVCSKDFLQQEHLKTHLRHHNNERPFSCQICNKSFNIKSSLQRHMNCHTGEKPFICGICNRGYTRRSVLMLHVQQVHENKKPFQCDACHLCFSQKGNLQAHFRRKHLQSEKGKKNIKRKKVLSTKNYSSSAEVNKSTMNSYASKVKAIVSRGARAQASENQRIVSKYSKSGFSYVNGPVFERPIGQSTSYNSLSDNSSSSCSLSDEAISGEDIPEINFPNILEGQTEATYDIKPLPDLELFLEDGKVWEDYMLTDTDNILSSSLPHYELNDVFSSPIKSNALVQKGESDEILSTIGWTDDAANPLFTADDLDDIKDISGNICGLMGIDGIKIEPCEQDKHCGQPSRSINHFNMLKGHLASSSMQA